MASNDILNQADFSDGRDGIDSRARPAGIPTCLRKSIETEIEKLLSVETDPGKIHNGLFAQGGLFHQLAPTKEERQIQRQSGLYKRAKARVNDLMLAAEEELKKRLNSGNANGQEGENPREAEEAPLSEDQGQLSPSYRNQPGSRRRKKVLPK